MSWWAKEVVEDVEDVDEDEDVKEDVLVQEEGPSLSWWA